MLSAVLVKPASDLSKTWALTARLNYRYISDMEQLSLEVQRTPLEAMIEARSAEAHAEIAQMVREAIEHINRSCGQRARHARERHQREELEFWAFRP